MVTRLSYCPPHGGGVREGVRDIGRGGGISVRGVGKGRIFGPEVSALTMELHTGYIPTLSLALAVTFSVPETVPALGVVSVMIGGVVSAIYLVTPEEGRLSFPDLS
jgi:hypothetical protein